MSYYDNSNHFKFDSDATIIIGQNNTGKSKLFDAYNWVLYNEAYKTETEEWKSTSDWGGELANKLAKKECLISSWVSVSVCLTFEDDFKNIFIVMREYRIQKLDEKSWNTHNDSELTVTKKTAVSQNYIHLSGSEAAIELSKFFPKNLSRYFLFQGEGISKLLSLNNRSDFNKAIKELSGVKYFSKASRYANNVYLRLKQEFEAKEENDSNIQIAKHKISVELGEIEDRLAEFDFSLENEYRERDIKQQKLEEKINALSRYEGCSVLLEQIKSLEKDLNNKYEERKTFFEYNRDNLLNSWMYAQVGSGFDNFLDLYRKGKEESKIPEPIRQDFIRQMLQEHVCKICGTNAPEGSDAFEHIAKHINERSLEKEIALINTLSDAADSMKVAINLLPENIENFKSQLNLFQTEINSLKERIDYTENELRILVEHIEEENRTKVNRDDLEKINLVQLKKDIDQIRTDLHTSTGKVDQLIGRKEEITNTYLDKKKEEALLVTKSSNSVERKRMQLAERIKSHAEQLHQDFLDKLIRDIEEEANEYFKSMTKNNSALSGTVRVDYSNKEVYPVDEHGRRMININQANKVSLQISFVAAVLSVSNNIWEKHFPFVADAPISALGGNNKLSAIKTMIDIFRQSIIILKDDASLSNLESVNHDEVRQLINRNSKIGNAYELKMHIGKDSDEQYTQVIKLK